MHAFERNVTMVEKGSIVISLLRVYLQIYTYLSLEVGGALGWDCSVYISVLCT